MNKKMKEIIKQSVKLLLIIFLLINLISCSSDKKNKQEYISDNRIEVEGLNFAFEQNRDHLLSISSNNVFLVDTESDKIIDTIKGNNINDVLSCNDYLLIADSLLILYDNTNLKPIDSFKLSNVKRLYKDDNNIFAITKNKGIFIFNIYDNKILLDGYIETENVKSFAVDDSNIYIGDDKKINILNKKTRKIHDRIAVISDIIIPAGEYLIIGKNGEYIYKYDKNSKEIMQKQRTEGLFDSYMFYDDYLIISDWHFGIRIFDIKDSLKETKSINIGMIADVKFINNKFYILEYPNTIHIVKMKQMNKWITP